MIQSKLVQLFQTLSAEDLRQIQKMLKSPYFTSNQNLQNLFKILRNKYPDFQTNTLAKEKIFARIFPKLSYSDIKLRNLMSELRQLIEQHLSIQQMEQDRFTKNLLLAKALIEKGSTNLMDITSKQLSKFINAEPLHNSNFYQAQFEGLQLQKKILHSRDIVKGFELIHEAQEALDNYYTFSKTKLDIELKSLSGFMATDKKRKNQTELTENINFRLYKDIEPLIGSNNIASFNNIKNDLFNNLPAIHKTVQVDILILLINFAIHQMKVDDKTFNTVVFELYQLGLQHQILTSTPLIVEAHFYNIVAVASREKDFEWATQFIQSHEHYLSTNTKGDLINSSYAYLYFHQKEYIKAIDIVIQYKFHNSTLNNVSKIHLIRCYYELFLQDDSYFDLLIAQTNTYEKYIQRNTRISESSKDALLNFARFIRRLANTRAKGKLKRKEQESMRQLVDQLKITASRSWLLEKIVT